MIKKKAKVDPIDDDAEYWNGFPNSRDILPEKGYIQVWEILGIMALTKSQLIKTGAQWTLKN